MIPNEIENIHESAVSISKEFRSCEAKLVEVLGQVEEKEVFRHLGYPSLFRYAAEALGLTESVAFALIQVVRTARHVPELKQEIDSGALSIFKAKKICSVLKKAQPEENRLWIEKAKNMSSRALEKEVMHVSSPEIRNLKFQITPELLERFERCQELVSQTAGKTATPEEVLEALVKFFVVRKDPVEKAKRNAEPDKPNQQQVTGPVDQVVPRPGKSARRLPAAQKHLTFLRDWGQCAHVEVDGRRCQEKKFLHFHHIQPVRENGSHSAENLRLLCSSHHRLLHWREGG